jgi:hypothetical protein
VKNNRLELMERVGLLWASLSFLRNKRPNRIERGHLVFVKGYQRSA